MRVLLDTCVWGPARALIAAAGHDVVWTGDWDEDPGDKEILARAVKEERVLVTLDKDFGTLAVRDGRPHSGIVRLVDTPARSHGIVCVELFEHYSSDLSAGAILTVETDRVRIRMP